MRSTASNALERGAESAAPAARSSAAAPYGAARIPPLGAADPSPAHDEAGALETTATLTSTAEPQVFSSADMKPNEVQMALALTSEEKLRRIRENIVALARERAAMTGEDSWSAWANASPTEPEESALGASQPPSRELQSAMHFNVQPAQQPAAVQSPMEIHAQLEQEFAEQAGMEQPQPAAQHAPPEEPAAQHAPPEEPAVHQPWQQHEQPAHSISLDEAHRLRLEAARLEAAWREASRLEAARVDAECARRKADDKGNDFGRYAGETDRPGVETNAPTLQQAVLQLAEQPPEQLAEQLAEQAAEQEAEQAAEQAAEQRLLQPPQSASDVVTEPTARLVPPLVQETQSGLHPAHESWRNAAAQAAPQELAAQPDTEAQLVQPATFPDGIVTQLAEELLVEQDSAEPPQSEGFFPPFEAPAVHCDSIGEAAAGPTSPPPAQQPRSPPPRATRPSKRRPAGPRQRRRDEELLRARDERAAAAAKVAAAAAATERAAALADEDAAFAAA